MTPTGYLACPWCSGVVTVTPSAACSLTVQADLPGTRSKRPVSPAKADPPTMPPLLGVMGLLWRLFSLLPLPGPCKPLGCAGAGKWMGEAEETKPSNRVRPFFPLWQQRADACGLQSCCHLLWPVTFFFKVVRNELPGPRENPAIVAQRGEPHRGARPAGPRGGAGRVGPHHGVLGSETSVLDGETHPDVREVTIRN